MTGTHTYAAAPENIRHIMRMDTVQRKTHRTAAVPFRRAEDLQARLCDAVARDAEAFEPLSKAYGIPKGEPGRDELMENCLRQAAAVPMDIAVLCCEGMDVLKEFSLKGSKLVISDAATAAVFCKAALQGAALNVRVNTALMKDREYAERLNSKLSDVCRRGCALADEIYGDVTARVG